MQVRVNAASFYSEARQVGMAARKIESSVTSAGNTLAGCAGMAGIDPMAEEFAHGAPEEGGYDQSARSMLRAGAKLSQAVAGFEAYLLGLAASYRAMELAGATSGVNTYASMTPTTVSGTPPYVGTSLGDEQRGTPQGEIMEWIENVLKDTAGIVIPTADTGKVRQAAAAWDSYSSALGTAKASVNSALPATLAAEFPQQAAVIAVQHKLAELIGHLSEDAKKLGDGVTSYADSVESIRGELLSMLGQLALEVAIDIGVGIALSFFTFGAGALAAAGKAAMTVARWIPRLLHVVERLKTLIMAAKRTMAFVRRAAIEGIQATVSGTVANATASAAFGNFSWSGLGGAAISSGIGGLVSGPFSHIGANIANRGPRITVRATVDGITGGAGGVAGEWAAAQVSGQDFNLLMSFLVGTAGGAAGGGLTSIKNPGSVHPTSLQAPPATSSGSSGSSAHPTSTGAPSSGGSSSGGAPSSGGSSGSGAPAAVATGGGGGAPAGGGSGAPSIDSSGVPGAGVGSSSGGSSSGAPAAGGAGVPDGHVDVPGALGGDGPSSGPQVEAPSPASPPPPGDSPSVADGGQLGSVNAVDLPAHVDVPSSLGHSDVPAIAHADAPSSAAHADVSSTSHVDVSSTTHVDVSASHVDASTGASHVDASAGGSVHAGGAGGTAHFDLSTGGSAHAGGSTGGTPHVDASTGGSTHAGDAAGGTTHAGDSGQPHGDAGGAHDGTDAGGAHDGSDAGGTDAPHQDGAGDGGDVPPAATENAGDVADANAASSHGDGGTSSNKPTFPLEIRRNPAALVDPSPEGQAIIGGTDPSGNGWHRVQDAGVQEPNYGQPRQNPGALDNRYAPDVQTITDPRTGVSTVTATHPGHAFNMLDGDPNAPFGYHPETGNPMTRSEWETRYVDANPKNPSGPGNMHFSPNQGAVKGTRVQFTDLDEFRRIFGNLSIDRVGDKGGSYMGIGGGTINDRALAPNQVQATELWDVQFVENAQLPPGYSLEISMVGEAYGLDGGGLQLVIRDANGEGVHLDSDAAREIFKLSAW